METMILGATVQIRVATWVVLADESGYVIKYATGHATLQDGRYLVTHNHTCVPMCVRPRPRDPNSYSEIILSDTNGAILHRGALTDFALIWEEADTLVLAHREEGFFGRLGLTSAEFADGSAVPLAAGMEVAQVDWDGKTTRVDWTAVQDVKVDDGPVTIVLSDPITIGASGGGVFWHGKHIGHNWLLVHQSEPSGAPLPDFTLVVLNSTQPVGPLRNVQ